MARTVLIALKKGRFPAMKEIEANRYRALLMAKRAEIAGAAAQREDLWIVQSNEQIETVQLASQREMAARRLEGDAKRLAQIGAALTRIDNGEFGICVDCGEPIPSKRLAAVPWAACCVRCQEIRDAEAADDLFEPKAAA